MNKKILVLFLSVTLIHIPSLTAQIDKISASIPAERSSIFINLGERQLDKTYITQNLSEILNLSHKHSLEKQTESTDNLGFEHIGYQQFFQGIKVDNGIILAHFKSGFATCINGRIAPIHALNTIPHINSLVARAIAKNDLDVTKELQTYRVELLITSVGDQKMPAYTLAYKVRIDGKTSKGIIVMQHVFIDAQTGRVLKHINLIATADVTATAQTLYNGAQTIVSDDSIPGKYRLKDNIRNITTYDATGLSTNDTLWSHFFAEQRDITNTTTYWEANPALTTITLANADSNLIQSIAPGVENYLVSMVVSDTGGSQSEEYYQSWPFVHQDVGTAEDLPVSAKNKFAFLKSDVNLMGGYGIVNLITASMEDVFVPYNTRYFKVDTILPGIHSWNDGQGNSGTYEIANVKNPALDAHWSMERTYDFYSQVLDRKSYDGKGSAISNYVNGTWPVMRTQNNAAALTFPYFQMVYGLGDGVTVNPLVSLDVVGHEFTHMVIAANGHGGLDYVAESGALNESFADIMGASIEFFAKGADANWLCGEDCVLPAAGGYFRSMSDPKSALGSPQPDTYEGEFWDTTNPHVNSGVQNKWFYLLCHGGAGTNDKGDSYNVYGIGISQAQQIAYRNLTQYLTPAATFLDAYQGSVQAAIDLYGSNSNAYHSVRNAWYAVGIGEQDNTLPDQANIDEMHIKLYPNPAKSYVIVSSEIERNVDARIMSSTGACVMDITIHKGINTFNMAALAKGLYFIKYDNGKDGYVQKLVIY